MNNKKLEKDPDLKPIHPGEVLREEFLIPLGLESEELANNIGVEGEIIKEIVEEKRDIDLSLSCLLGSYFGLRDDYWWGLQKRYNLDCQKEQKENEEESKLAFHASLWRLDLQIFRKVMDNVYNNYNTYEKNN